MEYRERGEPLGLSDLLLVYHDFLLALSRRTERLIQDFNAFIQCFNGRWMAAGFHNETGSLNPFGYEKSRWLGGSEFIDVIAHAITYLSTQYRITPGSDDKPRST
ncbi:hypothetical protein [Enterobacter hormaechei]|uniref:hypothetical protein n=1 Tax=Enterobacter hormaechei TaxID=158836 RepID=UPI00207CD10E|nr:hypothetical protein [Enterobacter hormaechei]MCO4123306.1 hypothetical protein [Enterobacter hormaechei]MCO4132052.1 hypothetical protein [Enterobacter hormaechei subsp. xiangfangensis]MCO4140469.1 hypothetical protein [Enterobacter hormaechei]